MTISMVLTLGGLVAMGGGSFGGTPGDHRVEEFASAEDPAAVKGVDGEVIRARYAGPHGEREYRLFLPDEAEGASLIVMLHGCTQDAEDLARGTRMDQLAGSRGIAVLYPEQDSAAHPLRCWNWYEPNHQEREVGEPALLAGMIREVAERYGLGVGSTAADADPASAGVVVVGLSAGGAMATILGLTYPELVRGVASHSGVGYGVARGLAEATAALSGTLEPDLDALVQRAIGALEGGGMEPPGPDADPLRGVPRLLVIHGQGDEIVAPVNAGWFLEQWAGLVEARTGVHPGVRDFSPMTGEEWGYSRLELEMPVGVGRPDAVDGTATPMVRILQLRRLGHAWSGGDEAGSFTEPRGPDASTWILDFFFPSDASASPGGHP